MSKFMDQWVARIQAAIPHVTVGPPLAEQPTGDDPASIYLRYGRREATLWLSANSTVMRLDCIDRDAPLGGVWGDQFSPDEICGVLRFFFNQQRSGAPEPTTTGHVDTNRACAICGAANSCWRVTWCKDVDMLSGFPLAPVDLRFACSPTCLGRLIDSHEHSPLKVVREVRMPHELKWQSYPNDGWVVYCTCGWGAGFMPRPTLTELAKKHGEIYMRKEPINWSHIAHVVGDMHDNEEYTHVLVQVPETKTERRVVEITRSADGRWVLVLEDVSK